MNKKVIGVLGCAGFIGSNICQRLIDEGYKVIGYDSLAFGYEKNVPKGMSFFKQSFSLMQDATIKHCDIFVDAATHNLIADMKSHMHTIRSNAVDTLMFFNRIPKDKKIVYLSTSSIYGNAKVIPTPETAEIEITNGYDTSKYIVELYLKSRGNYTTLRLTNTYGINQRPENQYCGFIGKAIGNALNNQPIEIIGDGMQSRDFNYCDDVVDAVMLAIEKDATNCELNLGTGKETFILSIPAYIQDILGTKIDLKNIKNRAIDRIEHRALLNEKIKYILGWSPKTNLLKGLKLTIEWQKLEYGNK